MGILAPLLDWLGKSHPLQNMERQTSMVSYVSSVCVHDTLSSSCLLFTNSVWYIWAGNKMTL